MIKLSSKKSKNAGQSVSTFTLYPLGDAAVVVRFGQEIDPEVLSWVRALIDWLKEASLEGIVECVPAYATVTVYYDPWVVSQQGADDAYKRMAQQLQAICRQLTPKEQAATAVTEIPVCYGGAVYGPDLAQVAAYHHLTPEEVIALHTQAVYTVYMIGFAPGFPYLGGLPEQIATPRRETPRSRVPAGSVGIAGAQTGIYPSVTPGGWQLIGRTYLPLFDPDREPPSRLQVGDRVRFVAISEEDYLSAQGGGV